MLDCNCSRLFTIFALALTLAACGGGGGKSRTPCEDSSACNGGVCFDQECYTACTGQDDCVAGEEFCVTRKDSRGVEHDLCVVASEYDGCKVLDDCVDLVVGVCESGGCDTASGVCFVRDRDDGVPCATDEGYAGVCATGECSCTPDCAGRECGPDSCGGFCGASSVGACPKANEACEDGTCVCQPDCTDRECGSDGCTGLCGDHGGDCPGVQDACVDGRCECQPACDGKSCGADGCGGTCGTCAGEQDACVHGECVCAPDCLQKECGDDGCGGFCGELAEGACPGPQDACVDGACVCQPACVDVDGGAACGPDGCGGFCGALAGACPGAQDACLAGVCTCQPACVGRECGSDGCGGFCGALAQGACPGAQDLCVEGQCVCQPACDGKVCGPDGCGGECGTCKGCSKCTAGACVDDPCCLVPTTGCCDGEVLRLCTGAGLNKKVVQQDCACDNDEGIPCGVSPFCGWQPIAQVYACGTNGGVEPTGALAKACPACIPACDGRECGPDGCGGDGVCGTCSPWDTCESGQCTNECEKSCAGKQCGPDACGGYCGTCGDGQTCDDGGHCVTSCTPQCSGRQCGPDGCGGTCGTCGEGLYCHNGECSGTCLPEACGDRQCGDDGCGGACGPYPEGVCPGGLSCTVDGACGNWCTTCSNDPSCASPGFETGTFYGWAVQGDAHVVATLGAIPAFEGSYMASLASRGLVAPVARATFDLCLPTDVNLVEAEWRVFSGEFEELCGQPERDRVEIAVEGRVDHRAVTVLSAGIADLCRPEACEACGQQFAGLDPAGSTPAEGDVWGTPWAHASAPLRTLLATNQGQIRLVLSVTGSSDGLLDTRLLVDAVHFTACDPQCNGAECGDDACGGFCGDLESGLCPVGGDVCTSDGQCCTPACFPGQECGTDGCEGSCGECGPHEMCVIGYCECQPDCTGKVCGDDGCGGTCGENAGQCPVAGDVCVTGGTCCTPACDGLECGDNGCGGDCWFTNHPDTSFCGVDTTAVCVGNACCVPSCLDRQCGDDGCGGDCGACPGPQDACLEHQCVCQPACLGFECGDDGCGSDCGTCEGPQDACLDHQCVCQPACIEKACGDDGCDGDCWWDLHPEAPTYCGAQNGVCVGFTCCQPDCTDKVCGTDGCGGSCGTCADGYACDGADCIEGAAWCADDDLCTVDQWNSLQGECEHLPLPCDDGDPLTHDGCNPSTGSCEFVPCTPGCDDAWQCGVDDCGQPCGTCEGAQDACVDGLCVCQPSCADKQCGDDGCGGDCGACPGPQDACLEHQCVCQPACDGFACGDDGCGGACGTCPGAQDACVEHQCVCQPACAGKVCGDDGCGNVCGVCGDGFTCNDGLCLPN